MSSMAEGDSSRQALDVVRDLRHPTHKVIGLLAWSIIGLSLIGAGVAPRLFLVWARVFAFYLLVRLIVSLIFHLVGVARCRAWEAQEDAASRRIQKEEDGSVHHVVVIPNYNEPVEILCRALRSLAAQRDARSCLTVVLAMEEREPRALDKARALQAHFASDFARVLITVHPADLPGEMAGKGSNQAWAAREAKQELVDRLGIPIACLTLTVCDADSVFHPHYFAALGRLFAGDPHRYHRFWFAPVFICNNIWQVPAVIRLLSLSSGAGRMGELSSPLSWPLPVSTYTLSYQLAHAVGYWDPAVISEDWHMFLRCFFALQGRVGLVPIYLPTALDAVDGETIWRALIDYYTQQVRHAWGAEDVGYILQQWRCPSSTPLHKRLFALCWVLHHHLLRSTSWFIIALGALTASLSASGLPGRGQPDLLWFLNLLGLTGSVAIWWIERTRFLPRDRGFQIVPLLKEAACWFLMPVFSLMFALPGLHAQTKLLLGSPLVFRRTPKIIRGAPFQSGELPDPEKRLY